MLSEISLLVNVIANSNKTLKIHAGFEWMECLISDELQPHMGMGMGGEEDDIFCVEITLVRPNSGHTPLMQTTVLQETLRFENVAS